LDFKAVGAILADIVEEAGRVVMPYWQHAALEVTSKADESPVTEADRAGERLILQRLREHFPDVPVVSEEHASEFGTPDEIGPRFFLVDPLDGTKAFVRGDERWTVNIGLIENGEPVAGAVSAPAWNRTWLTTADGAVRRKMDTGEAEPIRVRSWPQGGAVALVSHTAKPEQKAELRERYGFDHELAMDSSAKICMIAEATADIYPRHGTTMEWDIAAAHAVLVAAGGTLTTPEGEPFRYGKADQGFRNGWFVARGG
jgi:3'(2'), 5'-bisphosphate nucleotidase